MQLLNQPAGRRGYTVVELLIALIMAAVLCLGVLKVFVLDQRFTDALEQKVDIQQNLRTAMAMLPSELRQLNATDGDIKGMAADSITIRAMRQLAIVCNLPGTGALPGSRTYIVRWPIYSGADFVANQDSVFVWNEGASGIRTDDGWYRGKVTAVSTVNCTDGAAGRQLTISLAAIAAPMVNVAGGTPLGSPIRGFESVTYKVRQAADNRWYLNLANNGGNQPIIGPLTGSTGVVFTYFNSAGAATAVATQVAQIGMTIRSQSGRRVHLPGTATGFTSDSLSTRITLRNNPRY